MSAGGVCRCHLGVERVVTLAGKNGRQARPPDLLDRGQDAQLVVDQDIAPSRVSYLDVRRFLLLMDVNQHAACDRFKQSGTFDLARLKDHVAVR